MVARQPPPNSNGPQELAFDANGDLLIDDLGNGRVRLVAASNCSSSCPYSLTSTTAGYIYTVAGAGGLGSLSDGVPATGASLGLPWGSRSTQVGIC